MKSQKFNVLFDWGHFVSENEVNWFMLQKISELVVNHYLFNFVMWITAIDIKVKIARNQIFIRNYSFSNFRDSVDLNSKSFNSVLFIVFNWLNIFRFFHEKFKMNRVRNAEQWFKSKALKHLQGYFNDEFCLLIAFKQKVERSTRAKLFVCFLNVF